MRTENRRLDFIFFRAPLRCRKFFTLIELLITISIIALLSGMLLPSLMKARSSARGITCIGNLRQIGSIFHMYASDFDDWIIRGRTLSSAGTTTGLWLELMTKLNYQPEGADKKIRGGLFLCPEDQYPAYNPALVSSIRCSYGINTTIAQGMYGKIVDDPPGIDCRDRWRRFGALIGSVKKASNTPWFPTAGDGNAERTWIAKNISSCAHRGEAALRWKRTGSIRIPHRVSSRWCTRSVSQTRFTAMDGCRRFAVP